MTSDMRLNFPTAKAALEVTCGLPTYDMDGAAASAPRPRRMCHAPSVMPIMAPLAATMPMEAPASSLSCAVAPGKRSVSPQAGAGELLSCHASPTGTAALQHSRASSTSSAAFSSSYLQVRITARLRDPLLPLLEAWKEFCFTTTTAVAGSQIIKITHFSGTDSLDMPLGPLGSVSAHFKAFQSPNSVAGRG